MGRGRQAGQDTGQVVPEDAPQRVTAVAAGPAAVLGWQQSIGNSAVGRIIGRDSYADTARTKHTAEMEPKSAEAESGQLAGKLYDAINGTFAVFARKVERIGELLFSARAVQSEADLKDAYEKHATTAGKGKTTDLNAAIREACADGGEAANLLEHVLATGQMTPMDRLALALGLASFRGLFRRFTPLGQVAGLLDRALEILESTTWTEAELKKLQEEPFRKAFETHEPSLKRYQAVIRLESLTRDEKTEPFALREARVQDLTSKVRLLIYQTEHRGSRGHRMTAEVDAIFDAIVEWADRVDDETRKAALDPNRDFIKLLNRRRWLKGNFGHGKAMEEWDIGHAVRLISNRVVSDPENYGTKAREIVGGGVKQGAQLDPAALAEAAEHEDDPKARAGIEAKQEQAQQALAAADVYALIIREGGKTEAGRAHHRRLVEAVMALDKAESEILVALFDSDRAAALQQLEALLRQNDVTARHREAIVSRLRANVDEPPSGYARLVKLAHNFGRGRPRRIEDARRSVLKHAMSELTKMTPAELVEVRKDEALVNKLMTQLPAQGREAVERMLTIPPAGPVSGPADATGAPPAPATADDETQTQTLNADPAYWAGLIDYEFGKHSINRTVNTQKLAGVVQRAIWSMEESGGKGADVWQALTGDSRGRLTAISPRLAFKLAQHKGTGEEGVTALDRVNIAHRRGGRHDDEITAALEETPDERVLDEWSNARGLIALYNDKRALVHEADGHQAELKTLTGARRARQKPELIEHKKKALAQVEARLRTNEAAVDRYDIDVNRSVLNVVHKELKAVIGVSRRLQAVEDAIRRRIADAIVEDTRFQALTAEGLMSKEDLLIRRERVLGTSRAAGEAQRRKGMEHGPLGSGYRSLEVGATATRLEYAEYMSAHQHLAHEGSKEQTAPVGPGKPAGSGGRVPGGGLYDQGRKRTPERQQALERDLPLLKESGNLYDKFASDFMQARAQYSFVIRTIIQILVTALITAATAGIAGPLTVAGAILMQAITAGAGLIGKGIDLVVQQLIESVDLGASDIVKGVTEFVVQTGLSFASAGAGFAMRDVLDFGGGETMRQLMQFDPGGAVSADNATRVAKVAAYKSLEGVLTETMAKSFSVVAPRVEAVIDHRAMFTKADVIEELKGMAKDYGIRVIKDFVVTTGQGNLLMPLLGETWAESMTQEQAEKDADLAVAEAAVKGEVVDRQALIDEAMTGSYDLAGQQTQFGVMWTDAITEAFLVTGESAVEGAAQKEKPEAKPAAGTTRPRKLLGELLQAAFALGVVQQKRAKSSANPTPSSEDKAAASARDELMSAMGDLTDALKVGEAVAAPIIDRAHKASEGVRKIIPVLKAAPPPRPKRGP